MGMPSSVPLPRAFHEPISQKERSTPVPRRNPTELRSWSLQPLAPLPYYYQLDRKHVYIPDMAAEQVAQNIVECLRSNSIAGIFHHHENKVDAETIDHVKFAIRLWSDQGQVLVEVQRKCGCSFQFCESARLVLRAARGLTIGSSPSNTRPSSPRVLPMPLSRPLETSQTKEQILTDGLELAVSLLQKERIDAQLLAIESLVQLSRASYSRSFTAQYILKNDSVLTTLLSLIESYRMSQQADGDNLSELEKDHLSVMHRRALTVLGNCLDALEEDQSILIGDHLNSEDLLRALVRQIFLAPEKPHDAFQAVRCLRSLVCQSSTARDVALQLDASKAIAVAHSTGLASHQELQMASQSLLPEL